MTDGLRATRIEDPLGDGVEVELVLGSHLEHEHPRSELDALEGARLTRATVRLIDNPTADTWPEADEAFLDAIRAWSGSADQPVVWARVATAPKRAVVVDAALEGLIGQRDEPDIEGRPLDYYGPSLARLMEAAADPKWGGKFVLHHPSGDGWHRVAWMKSSDDVWVDLSCECDIAGVLRDNGGRGTISSDKCPYKAVAAYVRGRTCAVDAQGPDVLRELLDRALAGEWLGQPHGGEMWGSNLYLQTVSTILDLPMRTVWDLADDALTHRLIGLEGAVLRKPRPERTRPPGPIMPWDSQESSDPDGWIVWWARLDDRYQAEVVRDPDNSGLGTLTIYDRDDSAGVVHSEQVSLAYGAVFGPDVDDVAAWQDRAISVVSAD